MLAAVALSSLLVALLLAPMVLGTHVVVMRSSRRLALTWFLVLIGLMLVSLTLAAIAFAVSELAR